MTFHLIMHRLNSQIGPCCWYQYRTVQCNVFVSYCLYFLHNSTRARKIIINVFENNNIVTIEIGENVIPIEIWQINCFEGV